MRFTKEQIKRATEVGLAIMTNQFLYHYLQYKQSGDESFFNENKPYDGGCESDTVGWRDYLKWYLNKNNKDIFFIHPEHYNFSYYFVRALGEIPAVDELFTSAFDKKMHFIKNGDKYKSLPTESVLKSITNNNFNFDYSSAYRRVSLEESVILHKLDKASTDEERNALNATLKEVAKKQAQRKRFSTLYSKWMYETAESFREVIEQTFEKILGSEYRKELIELAFSQNILTEEVQQKVHSTQIEILEEDEGVIITDPCYLASGDGYLEMEEIFVPYFKDPNSKGIMRDTMYGDWSCSVFNKETKEQLGDFCADGGMVCVMPLKAIKEFNPNVLKFAKDHNWCITILEGFVGKAEFVVKGKGRSKYLDIELEGTLKSEQVKLIGTQTGF